MKKEAAIFTFGDLLQYFPYRHIDKTRITPINAIDPLTEYVQVKAKLVSHEIIGQKQGRRLVVEVRDGTGILELVWFQGINWVEKMLHIGQEYLIFGRVSFYQGQPQISHPEIEPVVVDTKESNFLEPVYPSTEKLKARGLGGRQIAKLTKALFALITEKDVPEILPTSILQQVNYISRFNAFSSIHFPANASQYEAALTRLKFDELFIAQLRMRLIKIQRHKSSAAVVFKQVGNLFNTFYSKHLPFELTGAQKRVLKEIRTDTATGRQMNRLLQGDVGSGKTIVALLSVLLAADNGFQSCFMAPTEILSRQHYESIQKLIGDLPLRVHILTGTTKTKERKEILAATAAGDNDLLIGTHALIEDTVQFKNLALAIVDEQHRFGVAQRAKLWKKAGLPPHVLVMTATPIPRTLAMTAYGDLDYSIMNELPPGRQPIVTVHRYDHSRPQVMQFVRQQIELGKQVYIIFPLIEESEKLDYENLMRGYENLKAWFPEPKYWISMVHGQQPAAVRETNMKRFASNDTQILVGTTVVEVGVNVPNATVMVIESAEKFGLSQLHQLRGRVGRGTDKSYCVLLTGPGLGKEAKERIKIMCETTDGFKIAEKDMEIRGPGDIAGTRQSGIIDFRLANIVNDKELLTVAGHMASQLVETDSALEQPENQPLRSWLQAQYGKTEWSKIS